MKKRLFLAPLLVVFVVLGSCKKIIGFLDFNVADSQQIVVPKTLPLSSTLVPLPPLNVLSGSKAVYTSYGTSADYVQDVTLDQLTLTITNPADQNFNFLQRIEIYISTEEKSEDLFLLASLDRVPANVTSISLTPARQKLDLFLSKGTYTLTTKVQLNSLLAQDVTIRADERFKVKARKP